MFASNEAEHDDRLRKVLQRLQGAGLTINEKCEFGKKSVRFLGHVIDGTGVHADEQKLEAIQKFPAPINTTELTQRTTPLLNGLSPGQLPMGRRLRTRLPVTPSTLQPGVQERDIQKAKEREDVHRESQ